MYDQARVSQVTHRERRQRMSQFAIKPHIVKISGNYAVNVFMVFFFASVAAYNY